MMPLDVDIADVPAMVADGVQEVNLPPGRHILSRPIVIDPDCGLTLTGAGPGVTEIVFDGDDDAAIVGWRDRPAGAVTLSGFTLYPGRARVAGIDVRAPKLFAANRGHAAEFFAQRVEVKAAVDWSPTYGFWVDKMTGPKIDMCYVHGRFADILEESLLEDGAMECAIETGGAQEAKITNSYVACARDGVHSEMLEPGCGEGIHVVNNAIINCLTPVYFEGQATGVFGGFATPWAVIAYNHLFYVWRGILLARRSDVVIHGNSLCGSHLFGLNGETVGVHMGGCQGVRMSDNHAWNPSVSGGKSRGYGYVIDASVDGTFNGNKTDGSVRTALYLANANGRTKGWRGAGNRFASPIGAVGNTAENSIAA